MRHYAFHIGPKSQPAGYRFDTRQYDSFQVICVQGGRVYLSVHGKDTPVEPGGVLLLRRGSEFTLYCRETGYEGVCLICQEQDPAFAGATVTFPGSRELREVASMVRQEAAAPGEVSREILEHLGWTLAWLAIRQGRTGILSGEKLDPARYWAECVRQAIDSALYAGRGAREILAGFRLSYRQLARYFTLIHGCSPKHYQIRARLEEARRLLRETRLPVTTIALELGFASSQHFATQFLRLAGQSPGRFRGEKEKTHSDPNTSARAAFRTLPRGARRPGEGRHRP